MSLANHGSPGRSEVSPTGAAHYKDAVLDGIAHHANVAQFVSFGPDIDIRYNRITGWGTNHKFQTATEAIRALVVASAASSVNVRSFDPADPKSKEFVYGIRSVTEAEAAVRRLGALGLHTIVNETIDVCDGGVSGVMLGDVLEFAPGDTPRAVEKPGAVQMPRAMGLRLLAQVYGFAPDLPYSTEVRVEFSIHPLRTGFRQAHTIVWELEDVGVSHSSASIRWPNLFSRFMGDKAFGLLIAHLHGFPVPRCTVVGRNLAPFSFGRATGSGETWLRTCPVEQVPGRFTTRRGWTDPYRLMHDEDPDGGAIASVIAQEGVTARYSGALVATEVKTGRSKVIIEGTSGFGDDFMTGGTGKTALPPRTIKAVRSLYRRIEKKLGPVRLEWVDDGKRIWVVQLHRGSTQSSGNVIYPGNAERFYRFDVALGLEALRKLIATVKASRHGIVLIGDVGITSHFGDVLRRAEIPSRLENPGLPSTR